MENGASTVVHKLSRDKIGFILTASEIKLKAKFRSGLSSKAITKFITDYKDRIDFDRIKAKLLFAVKTNT